MSSDATRSLVGRGLPGPVGIVSDVRRQLGPGRLPRVLAVIPASDEWALAFFVRQMESIRAAGCEVESFFLTSRTNVGVLLRERRRLRARLRAFQPEVVHAQNGTMTAFFTALATARPLVISFRGSDLNPPGPDDRPLRVRVGHVLSHLSSFRARRIICVSKEVQSRLLVQRTSAAVIPTGVNLQLFHPRPQAEARARLGWPANERVVLFAPGTTDRSKGGDLVRAAVRVTGSLVPAPVRLESLDGGTHQDEVGWVMNAADCLAFGSLHEGSPNIVKEAIASGLPVVSVEVGDVRERLDGVVPSAIVPRDPEVMGRALAVVLNTPQRSNGPDRIHDVSEPVVAQRILELYRSCVEAGKQRR